MFFFYVLFLMSYNKQLEWWLDTNTYLNIDLIKIPEKLYFKITLYIQNQVGNLNELKKKKTIQWLPMNNFVRLMKKNTLSLFPNMFQEVKKCFQECVS